MYPNIADVQMRQNIVSRDNTLENIPIRVQMSAPLYVSQFQSTALWINISNLSVDETIRGDFVLQAYGKILINDVEIEPAPSNNQTNADDGDKDGEYRVSFLLKPNETLEKNLSVRMAKADKDSALITFTAHLEQVSSKSVKNEIIEPEWRGIYKWEDVSLEQSVKDCRAKVSDTKIQDKKICAINYPYGSFAESSLSKLLLPPWSGLSSLALVFGVVWLLEQFMLSYGAIKIETLTPKEQWGYAIILLFFNALLLFVFTIGMVIVFKSINYSFWIYYGVLLTLILIALGCAFFVSWFFKNKLLATASSDSNDVFKLIKEAYERRNLLRVEEIRNSYDKFDVRYKYADAYCEDLKSVLDEYVKGMITFCDEKNYLSMLQKTEFLFRENKRLWYLPDPEHKIEVFSENKDIKKISSGWIFRNPEESENSIYFSLIDGLGKLSSDELKNKNICEQIIAKFSIAKEENWSDAFKSLEKHEKIKDLFTRCKNSNDNKLKTE